MRARFRNGLVNAKPVTAGKVQEYQVDLHTQDYRFRRGTQHAFQPSSRATPTRPSGRYACCRTDFRHVVPAL